MTTDDFTTAARAEAERRADLTADPEDFEHGLIMKDFLAGAAWARGHLNAEEPTDAECIYILNIVCSPFGEEDKESEWAPAAIQRCREAMVRARAARRDEEKR